MPLDGVAANFLYDELSEALIGKRLERIYQPAKHDLQLYFRSRDRDQRRLFISVNPTSPHLHLLTEQRENPLHAPNFCMMLRKYLLGAVLENILHSDSERVFEFVFLARDELGDQVVKSLIVEVIGRYSNVILINSERIIHDCMVHVDSGINRVREVMPARRYQAPPALPQPSIAEIAVSSPRKLLEQIKMEDVFANCDLVKTLLNLVKGMSPMLATEVVYRSRLDSRQKVRNLFENDLFNLLQNLQQFCLELTDHRNFKPTLYFADEECREVIDFHALCLQHLPYKQTAATLSSAMQYFYRCKNSGHSFAEKRQHLKRQLDQRIKKLCKKINIHERDLDNANKLEDWQRYGELLTCQLHLVKSGAEKVEIIDYYDEKLPVINVPLIPSLSPKANAERYFKKYSKGKLAAEASAGFLEREYAELAWLKSLYSALEVAENQVDLDSITEELSAFTAKQDRAELPVAVNQQPGKPGRKKYKAPAKTKKVRRQPMSPMREFVNSEGIKIIAGRNNLQNDRLTLKQADKNFVWFHVKQFPGSHVVAEIDFADISERTLLEAASVAAWYSGAKSEQPEAYRGGKISVDFCPVKNVKKPRRAKPGMVVYDNYETIHVSPSDPLTYLESVCPER